MSIELEKNYGQIIALAAGIDHAKGDFIVTLDGDLQNDPNDIPMMLEKAKNEDWDLVDTIQPRKVYSTPETDLDIMQSALEEASIEEVNQAFKDYWDTDDFTLFLTTKEEEDVTSEQLKRLFLLVPMSLSLHPPLPSARRWRVLAVRMASSKQG